MTRRLTLVAAVLVASACSGDDGRVVTLVPGQRFEPPTITIQAGETVAWPSDATDLHTITAYEESLPAGAEYFASGGAESEDAARGNIVAGLIEEGETFEWTFEVAGRYEYFCIPHEDQGMKGVVLVEG